MANFCVFGGAAKGTSKQFVNDADTIGRMLAALIKCNWQPMMAHADPVEWRQRCWNSSADYLCNFAMDSKTSCHHIDTQKLFEAMAKGCNLQLHSRGVTLPLMFLHLARPVYGHLRAFLNVG